MTAGSDTLDDDFNRLYQHALAVAERLLSEQEGTFAPFAAAIRQDGRLQQIGAEPGADPAIQIELLEATLRELAGGGAIRASTLCLNVRLRAEDGSETDALEFHIEHRQGTAQRVRVPYTRAGETYRVEEGRGTAVAGRIFSPPQPPPSP